ncbi:MAG: PhzF family phenazine biosynthesis protein [Alphaproteobacteria bacterium]
MKLYQIDAFADAIFGGNPAAVIKLGAFPSEALMQNIAMENNLAETAYVVPRKSEGHFDLRWFTPTLEIDFCGHATIATAHALREEYGLTPPFHFHTKVGDLIVSMTDGLYNLDAPAFPARETELTAAIKAAFPVPLESAFWASDNLYVVFKNEDDIRTITPDMSLIRPLSDHGVGITAAGSGAFDCVSRFFVPAQGIDEDPVTGSAHAAIGPYWSGRLGKTELTAFQASKRSGILRLSIKKQRLTLSGGAVTYMEGKLRL